MTSQSQHKVLLGIHGQNPEVNGGLLRENSIMYNVFPLTENVETSTINGLSNEPMASYFLFPWNTGFSLNMMLLQAFLCLGK
jgi:hypothetical protein